jgi:hypothetical protein
MAKDRPSTLVPRPAVARTTPSAVSIEVQQIWWRPSICRLWYTVPYSILQLSFCPGALDGHHVETESKRRLRLGWGASW